MLCMLLFSNYVLISYILPNLLIYSCFSYINSLYIYVVYIYIYTYIYLYFSLSLSIYIYMLCMLLFSNYV